MRLQTMTPPVSDNGDIQAAAVLIDPGVKSQREYLELTIQRARTQVGKAWKWYRGLGDIHYAVSRSAKIAGYTKLVPKRVSGDEDIHDEAKRITRSIYSRYGGVRGLVQRYYTCMKIPGEAVLLRMKDERGNWDGYHFASSEELEIEIGSRRKIRWITLPEGHGTNESRMVQMLDNDQIIGRVWIPGQEYIDLPDTPMIPLEQDCESLHILNQTIRSRLVSRLAMSGILYLPSEVQTTRSAYQGATQIDGDKIKVDDVFLDRLLEAMKANVMHSDERLAAIPILIKGPGEQADNLRHITLDVQIFETDLNIQTSLTQKILQGMDVQRSMVEGGERLNHWATWSASEEERRVAVQPDIETMAWALTRMVLHREMLAARIPEDIVRDHYFDVDLSAAAIRSNQQEDSRQLFDRRVLGGDGLMRIGGFPPEEAMQGAEMVRAVGSATKNPYLMMWGLPESGVDPTGEIDWTTVASFQAGIPGPVPGSEGEEPSVGPGVGEPGGPNDRKPDDETEDESDAVPDA